MYSSHVTNNYLTAFVLILLYNRFDDRLVHLGLHQVSDIILSNVNRSCSEVAVPQWHNLSHSTCERMGSIPRQHLKSPSSRQRRPSLPSAVPSSAIWGCGRKGIRRKTICRIKCVGNSPLWQPRPGRKRKGGHIEAAAMENSIDIS